MKAVVSTTLSFGLVSTEVKIVTPRPSETKGTKTQQASPDGHPVKQVWRDEETGELYEPSQLTKGIFDADGFHEVGKETLSAIDEECKLDALNIDRFIDLADVPFERVEGCYFIAPSGKGGAAAVKPLALLRDGLKAQSRAGIGRLTVRTKTYPVAIFERDGALYVATMSYASAFKSAEAAAALDGAETDEQTLSLAKTLFDQLAGTREDLDALSDDRFEKREELFAKVIAGEKIEVAPKAEPVVEPAADLAALLAASVADASGTKPKKAAKKQPVAA